MKILKTTQALNLALWAAINILIGGIFLFKTEAHHFYFHAMNISWNIVNTGVAAFLYFHHNGVFKKPLQILKQMDYQRHVEKIIMFNLGLDLSFIATGFALYYNGHGTITSYPVLWIGFGISVILQGSFLLIQDLIFYRLHLKNRDKVYPYWKNELEKLQN